MSVPVAEQRRELKFVATESALPELEMWLRLHPARFSEAYPRRRVNSVYFDDAELSTFGENLAGVSERTKLRYRWYGDEILAQAGTLEVKQRRNAFGWKLQFPVAESPTANGDTWREVLRNLRRQLPAAALPWLERLPRPVLLGRYLRDYYLSADQRVRITVDRQLRIYDQRNGLRMNTQRAAPFAQAGGYAPSLILEAKAAREDRELVDRVLQGIPIRVSRCSKYATGVEAILGV